jgi:hypothetical protein
MEIRRKEKNQWRISTEKKIQLNFFWEKTQNKTLWEHFEKGDNTQKASEKKLKLKYHHRYRH